MGLSSQTNSTNDRKLLGYRVQTSIKGTTRPVVIGTNRVPGYVLWANDWQSIPDPSSGGKSAKGGKGGGENKVYESGIILGLCRGPINDILNIWRDQVEYTSSKIAEQHVIPGGLTITPSQWAFFSTDHGVGLVASYSQAANDYGGPGSTTITGQQIVKMTLVGSAPASGQYTLTAGVYGFASADVGKTVWLNYAYFRDPAKTYAMIPGQSYSGKPVSSLDFYFADGDLGQAVWPHLDDSHPEQSLSYSLTAYVANATMLLGSSGVSPNYNFEISGLFVYGAGVKGAKISDCIKFCLEDGVDGVAFAPSLVGDMSSMDAWCLANNIFLSPLLASQRKAADWIGEFLIAANTAPVFSDGVLKFRPYGDTTCVGNGAVYIPATAPVYDLNDDWIMGDIEITRLDRNDADNVISVQFLDAANGYYEDVVTEQDEWAIGKWGVRNPGPITITGITDQPTAATIASIILKNRVNKLNTYKVPVTARAILIEPMDLVTLTRVEQGLNMTPVRVIEVSEDSDLKLTLTCEEFPWGTAQPTLNPKQTSGGYAPGYFDPPGSCNPPVFFEATSQMTKDAGFVLEIALSGGPTWGGAVVWVSRDGGDSYDSVGQIRGGVATGNLTAPLAMHPSPNLIDTLSVDLTESSGSLPTWSQSDVDGLLSLVVVDSELIAYKTATLTGSSKYDLTYMQRGVFGTTARPHATGSRFAILYSGLPFEFPFEVGDIGTTLWFKFGSFNRFGQNQQDITDASVVAYPFYIPGNATRLPFAPNGGSEYPVYQDAFFPQAKFQITPTGLQNDDGSVTAGVEVAPVVPASTFSGLVGGVLLNPTATVDPAGTSMTVTTSSTPNAFGFYPVTWTAGATTFQFSRAGDTIMIAGSPYIIATVNINGSGQVVFATVTTNPGSGSGRAAAVGIDGNRTRYYAIAAQDSANALTDLSNVVEVDIPAGSNVNKIKFTVDAYDSNATAFFIYTGNSPQTLANIGAVPINADSSTPPIYTITLAHEHNNDGASWGMPDGTFDHFAALTTTLDIPGSFTGSVVGYNGATGVVTLQDMEGNPFTFSSNALRGRIISTLWFSGIPDGPTPLQDCVIRANGASTVTIFAPGRPLSWAGLGDSFQTGDIIVIRLQATTYTGITIGDSLLAMGPDAYAGKVLRAFYPDGASQTAFIASNTSTVFTLQSPLNLFDGATPLWFWVEAASFGSRVDNNIADVNQYLAGGAGIFVSVPNTPGFCAVVLFAVDAANDLSDVTYSPLRDFYCPGYPGTGGGGAGSYQIES